MTAGCKHNVLVNRIKLISIKPFIAPYVYFKIIVDMHTHYRNRSLPTIFMVLYLLSYYKRGYNYNY